MLVTRFQQNNPQFEIYVKDHQTNNGYAMVLCQFFCFIMLLFLCVHLFFLLLKNLCFNALFVATNQNFHLNFFSYFWGHIKNKNLLNCKKI